MEVCSIITRRSGQNDQAMRQRLDAGLKARTVLEVLSNELTVAELAAKIRAAREPG